MNTATTNRHNRAVPRRRSLAAGVGAPLLAGLMTSSESAATCLFVTGGLQVNGLEPPLAVAGSCTDPDYNENTLVIDSIEQRILDLPAGAKIAYTEVKAIPRLYVSSSGFPEPP